MAKKTPKAKSAGNKPAKTTRALAKPARPGKPAKAARGKASKASAVKTRALKAMAHKAPAPRAKATNSKAASANAPKAKASGARPIKATAVRSNAGSKAGKALRASRGGARVQPRGPRARNAEREDLRSPEFSHGAGLARPVGEADERVGRSVRRGVGRDDVHDYDHDDRGTPGASSGSEALDAASEAALADGDAPSDGVDAEPSGEDLAPMRDAGTPHVVARPIPKREGPPPTVQEFAIELAQALRDDKCEDVQLLDVRTIRDDVDFIVIASGTSDRQMRSVLRHAKDLGASCGWHSVRSNADERATWLLADFVGVIVHLFEPSTRAHYDLEMLWGDAPRIAWERPDQAQRDLAGLTPRARR